MVASQEVHGTKFTVYQCRDKHCRHGFTHPLPSEQVLEKIYADDDLNDYQLDEGALKGVDDFFSHLFVQYVPQGCKAPGAVLDVGAGIGSFMHSAKKNGWQVSGIEFNRKSVEIGKKMFGLEIVNGNFYKLEDYFPGMRFEMICMNHVFEHVLEPRLFLTYLSGFLKPGGCFLITVPNVLSDDFKRLGSKWSYIHIPAHISYFSRDSMDRLFLKEKNLQDAGACYSKVFQSSFNSSEQAEGEGLTSMYKLQSVNAY